MRLWLQQTRRAAPNERQWPLDSGQSTFPRESGSMIVLASASPRRQELLRNAGIAFTVQPADIDESPRDGESPVDCAQRLTREKPLPISLLLPQDCFLFPHTLFLVTEK